jgi:hypothetical protein
MLKIWLTWLQPSLGVLGTALVLSYPLYSYAAPKPVVAGKFNKAHQVPVPVSGWSIAKSSGTTIDNELSSAIAITPDMAVRQLAMGSMATSGLQPIAPKKTLHSNRDALAKFIPPSSARFQNLAAQPTKPQNVKNSVAEALARASNIQAPVKVPGLYIGTADVRVSARVLPTAKPLAQAIASSEIGAPTPLSAMMAAKATVDPFPVVRPELMQKLDGNRNAARIPVIQKAPQALNPLAAIPTRQSKAVAPKAIAHKVPEYHSLDPIAAIPSGLQRLLGNNLNSVPTVAATPLATTTTATPNPMVALRQFISPTGEVAPVPVTAASLQLATAQAYAIAPPKFSIPGETILAAKSSQPTTTNVLVVKRVQKNLTATAPVRKSKYVAILSELQLTPTPKQPWMLVDRPTNLGGLILGSQSPAAMPKVVGLTSANTLKNSTSVGLPARNILNIN